MKFIKKKVSTETLGEFLESRRNNLGLALEEVAKITRLQPKYLHALESCNLGALPAAVYVKGFLRELAKLYRLDANDLIRRYEAENALAENVQIIDRSPQGLPKLPRFVFTPKTVVFSIVALVGLGSLSYLYFQVNSLVRPPRLVIESPSEDGTTNLSLQLLEGSAEPGSDVYLNGQEIVVDAAGNFKENLSLGIGGNQLVIKAVNKFGKETIITRSLVLVEKEIAGTFIAVPEDEVTATTTSEFVAEIRVAPDDSWVNIVADEVVVFSGTMLAGSARRVTAVEEVVITTGNAGSTSVVVNGEDRGVLGESGQVLRGYVITNDNL